MKVIRITSPRDSLATAFSSQSRDAWRQIDEAMDKALDEALNKSFCKDFERLEIDLSSKQWIQFREWSSTLREFLPRCSERGIVYWRQPRRARNTGDCE